MALLNELRQFNLYSVILRLTLAVLFGGIIGVNREHKHRPAGFRTYMMVCMGAALTMVLGQYQYAALSTLWADAQREVGMIADVTRLGAQVINGIGFLGTGTILVTEQREVKGLTTAAGLWATACVGLAVGAGFYEGVLLGFLSIFLCIEVLPYVEEFALARSRNMNLYVELETLEQVREFIAQVKELNIQVYDMELERQRKAEEQEQVSVVFYLRLPKHQTHTKVLTQLAYSPAVKAIDEI
ncbi:MgtC/SapB family protein [Pseudoflavonifractor sp. 60]|uniref:MgtC/SapB family protein n=1 Tax=Pseudoflavonifractor sp. 60 TaxID=2304576 RepID=UPI00136EFFCF|nr:MgtC/SapB family protein [Pseudoflavonifractor sp. 60]NBI66791.1 MgtC/SapB family protein [Pseudoflavonifractor sp. 60]